LVLALKPRERNWPVEARNAGDIICVVTSDTRFSLSSGQPVVPGPPLALL